MNTCRSLVTALAAVFIGVATLPAQSTSTTRAAAPDRKSPHDTVSAVIGDRRSGNRVTITYGRPQINDPKSGAPRKIWGALVPWDKPYRLGADEATTLITQQPLVFGGTTIPAGAYTLYQIPSEHGPSKLAFSSAIGKWGIPVDETHDVARVDLTKASLAEPVDRLTLGVENVNTSGGGVLRIRWEKTEFSAPFTVGK